MDDAMAIDKTCTKCGQPKPLSEFHNDKNRPDGKYPQCKVCKSAAASRHYSANSDRIKSRLSNRRDYNRRYYEANRERELARSAAYRRDNPDRHADAIRRSNAKFYATPRGKLEVSVSGGMRRGLLGGKAGISAFSLLDYSVDDLKRHIERQFHKGMSWANYGDWHVDHIIPMSSFSYSTPNDRDFKACWALTNLRPLWATENKRKHAKRTLLL